MNRNPQKMLFGAYDDELPARFDVRVHPVCQLNGRLEAQPSKNYTTRYVLAAALAEGTSHISGVANSEDAQALYNCLHAWGAEFEQLGTVLQVQGFGGKPRAGQHLDIGNAGAVCRFLMAIAALTENTVFHTEYKSSLGKRPHDELLEALSRLGVQVQSQVGKLPVTICGEGLQDAQDDLLKDAVHADTVLEINTERSSQFASALMFLAPLLPSGLNLHLLGEIKSRGPLLQTLETLRTFGIQLEASADLRRIDIAGGQVYQGGHFSVPGDYPGAVALLTAGALTDGEIEICGLRAEDLQGEREAIAVLEEMGADIRRQGDCVSVQGKSSLRAVRRDGDQFTDAVQVLSAAAAYAEGRSTWYNVETLRLKECDRISDTRRELERLGLEASETSSSLSLSGFSSLSGHHNKHGKHGKHDKLGEVSGGITVNGHQDHRMIMMLTLIGLRTKEPLYITGAHHIRKSYPLFFRHLESLGARFDYLPKSKLAKLSQSKLPQSPTSSEAGA